MVAAKLDLITDSSVEIGADYLRQISVCNQPDLTLYTGICQVRNVRDEVVISPTITIQSPTLFSIVIPATVTLLLIDVVGDLMFDVLFTKSNHRFFAVRGKLAFINTITRTT